jgi:hypothetical protein
LLIGQKPFTSRSELPGYFSAAKVKYGNAEAHKGKKRALKKKPSQGNSGHYSLLFCRHVNQIHDIEKYNNTNVREKEKTPLFDDAKDPLLHAFG